MFGPRRPDARPLQSARAVALLAGCTLALSLSGCGTSSRDSATEDGSERSAGAPAEVAGATLPAPDFTLPDLRGEPVRLSNYRGKVVLLDFWATWCGPCRMEIPHFQELTAKYGEKGFVVIAIAMDETGAEVVGPFVDRNQITYPVVLGDAETAELFGGVTALPTTYLIDRAGNMVRKYSGYQELSTFEQDITPLL